MSDDDSDNGKAKGFDISKVGGEMSDEERAAADERLRKQFKELTEGSAVMKDALRDIGGAIAIGEAMASVNRLQDAIKASGIGSMQNQVRDAMSGLAASGIQDHLSILTGAGVMDQLNAEREAMEEARKAALGGLPEGYMDHLVGAQTAASRLIEEMRENHRLMFQHVDIFADVRRSIEAVMSFDLDSVLKIPRMDNLFDTLGIDRIGSALAAADAASILGFPSAFNDDILAVTSQINEQVSAHRMAQEAASAALGLGITERLEEMLARSIAAQETLVDEYREAAKDAKVEAVFHRRNATISTIINLLMFLLALALQIEERITDRDEAVRANTEAVRELQQSFDGIASQMERLRVQAESASAEEQAADAAITDLLREIANSLAEQSDMEGEDADAESPPAD
jgi:hypothetical protein